MPIYEFTLVVTLPRRAMETQTYVGAWISAECPDATVGAVSPGQIELIFRRGAISENWAVRNAINDFTKVARAVRRGVGRRKETYEFEVLMGDEKIGEATYEITENMREGE